MHVFTFFKFDNMILFQMKWTEVVQDCSQAVKLNPHYIKALFRRAKALEKLDNKKECLEGKRISGGKKVCFSVEP